MPQPSSNSTFDPKTTALLVIDVQRGLFTRSTPVYQAHTLLPEAGTVCLPTSSLRSS